MAPKKAPAKKVAEAPKVKGKDKGKGKKPVASESEEGSDAELLRSEESEASEELSEDDKGKKGKGKLALKGATKAVALKGIAKPKLGEEDPQKGGKRANIKATSKVVAGFAADAQKNNALTGLAGKVSPLVVPPPKKQKKGLKSTSRLFMRLSGNKKKKEPQVGRLFGGFGKKPIEKSALDSTSKFMTGFPGIGTQNKKESETSSKSSLLANLGGKTGKTAAATTGLGNKCKGLFGKQKTGSIFKRKGLVLGKISGAANWLTGRFISSKTQGLLAGRGNYNRPNMGRYRGYQNEGYVDDEDMYGYVEDDYDHGGYYDGYSRGQPRRPGQHFEDDMEYYYDPYDDPNGYYEDENGYYRPMNYEDEYDYYYEDYYGEYDGPYGYYDDGMDYYEYGQDEMYDYPYYDDGMEYYDDPYYYMEDEYGYNGNDIEYYDYGMFPEEIGYYNDPHGLYYTTEDLPSPYMMPAGYPNQYRQYIAPSSYYDASALYLNPVLTDQQQYAFAGGNIIEQVDPTQQIYNNDLTGITSVGYGIEDTFRFPRPQVKLFGKEKIEVANLPSPHFALNDFEMPVDVQYDIQAMLPPQTVGFPQPAVLPEPTVMAQKPLYQSVSPILVQQSAPIVPGSPILGRSPVFYPAPQVRPLTPQMSLSFSPNRQSFGSMGPVAFSAPPSPILSARGFIPNMAGPQPYSDPMFHGYENQFTPLQSPYLPRRQFSIATGRGTPVASHMEMGPMFTPRQPRRFGPQPQMSRRSFHQSINNNAQRSFTPLQRRKFSPPPSPQLSRRGPSPQPSIRGRLPPPLHPLPRRETVGFSRPYPPERESCPPSPRGSFRKRSPPTSPRPILRQSVRSPPPLSSKGPTKIFGERPHEPPLPSRSFRGRPTSPQPSLRASSPPPLSRFSNRASSPTPSRVVRSGSPRPASPHTPGRPLSPSPSRVSNRMSQPEGFPTRTSTRRFRGVGRNKVPMRAVKPTTGNPLIRRRSRQGPPLMQNVAPFRTSVHTGRRSSDQSPTSTPVMLVRKGSRPPGFRESKRFLPPGAQSHQRGFRKPVGRGHPVVRPLNSAQSVRQSLRGPGHPLVMNVQSPFPQHISQSPYHQQVPQSPFAQQIPQSPFAQQVPQTHFMQQIPQTPFQHNISQSFQQAPQSFQQSPQYAFQQVPQSPFPQQMSQSPIPQQFSQSPIPQQFSQSPFPQQFSQSPFPQQVSLKQAGQLSPQLSVRQVPSRPLSPQPSSKPGSPLPARSPSPANLSSPMLSGALLNQNLQRASFRSPFPTSGSPITQQIVHQTVQQAPSPLLSNALIQNPQLRQASYMSPIQRAQSPQPEMIPQQIQQMNLRSSPGLANALQNPHLRNASYISPLHMASSPGTQVAPQYEQAQTSSSVLSSALQNPYLRNASFTSPLQRIGSPYSPMMTQTAQIDPRTSPMLTSALMQNPNLRNASFISPFQTNPMHEQGSQIEQQTQASSPFLGGALQNPLLRNASYISPLQRNIGAQAQVSSSPTGQLGLLSNALSNPHLRGASFQLPDGTIISPHSENKTEQATPSLLSSALQNPTLRKATYRLPDGTLITRNEVVQAPSTSPLLSNALQNASVRKATYRLPDGSILTLAPEQPEEEQSSSKIGSALSANLKRGHKLPDMSFLSKKQPQKPSSPLLSGALKNANLRNATYRLPDGTLLRQQPEEEEQSFSPHLSSALQNANLRAASYRLPDGSLLLKKPGQKEQATPSMMSSALMNQNLRKATYKLPDGSIVTRRQAPQTIQASSPFLSSALLNPNLRNASFKLGGSPLDPSGRYAVVSPQVQGMQQGEHWAQDHTVDGQLPCDVWSAERVLPHGTVQNLTKWSMYRDEELLDPSIPPYIGQEADGAVPEWAPDREGEPQGNWYDKVTNKGVVSISVVPLLAER